MSAWGRGTGGNGPGNGNGNINNNGNGRGNGGGGRGNGNGNGRGGPSGRGGNGNGRGGRGGNGGANGRYDLENSRGIHQHDQAEAPRAPIEQMAHLHVQERNANVNGAGNRPPRPPRIPETEFGQRAKRVQKENDIVKTELPPTKVGVADPNNPKVGGKVVKLVANYFPLTKKTDWCVFSYWVDFQPDQENTRLQKRLMRDVASDLGTHVFDGKCLWTTNRLPQPLEKTASHNNSKIGISIKLVGEVDVGDPARLQFFNIILRTCFSTLGLEQIQRHFFDPASQIPMPEQRLTIWPGYQTTLRQYEQQLMLNVGIVHKVLRNETALDVMHNVMAKLRVRDFLQASEQIKDALVGATVMTSYNRKFYKVHDVDFTKTPSTTFPKRDGSDISFISYYREKHNTNIREQKQPLLISRPSKKDLHGGRAQNVLLVPELCTMTGFTDEQRSNPNFMRDIGRVTLQNPTQKLASIQNLVLRLHRDENVRNELDRWGLGYGTRPVELNGRELLAEEIEMGPCNKAGRSGQKIISYDKNDTRGWQHGFRDTQMYDNKVPQRWIVVSSYNDSGKVDLLVQKLQFVGKPMDYKLAQPLDKIVTNGDRIDSFRDGIREAWRHFGKLNLVLIVLPINKKDFYAAVKKLCFYELGVASQCILGRNLGGGDSKFLSICTKMIIQINTKLGGTPWIIDNPFKSPANPIMVVGFDVYHCGRRVGKSVGAMVATTNRTLSSFYSTSSHQLSGQEISNSISTEIIKCVIAHAKTNNGLLPRQIVFYRDGVGEGQLIQVVDTELDAIKGKLKEYYESMSPSQLPPKLAFIVVTKRITARLFKPTNNGQMDNPSPGTIVDNVITLPERYDFYMISHHGMRDSTVSPISYHVIQDDVFKQPNRVQIFTYKMTHNYYNWSGMVSVPGVCQYAHKLAGLTGQYLGEGELSGSLAHSLYYL